MLDVSPQFFQAFHHNKSIFFFHISSKVSRNFLFTTALPVRCCGGRVQLLCGQISYASSCTTPQAQTCHHHGEVGGVGYADVAQPIASLYPADYLWCENSLAIR